MGNPTFMADDRRPPGNRGAVFCSLQFFREGEDQGCEPGLLSSPGYGNNRPDDGTRPCSYNSPPSALPRSRIVQELNPCFYQIQDLQERCASLRGYL